MRAKYSQVAAVEPVETLEAKITKESLLFVKTVNSIKAACDTTDQEAVLCLEVSHS